jgi:hypothetical protein
MTDDDIKTVQELLAKDKSVYPQGLATGYFGQMTKEALKRFQAKNGLPVTGELDTKTRAALEAIMEQRKVSGKDPIQLLLDEGLKQKFEKRLEKRCEKIKEATDEQQCKEWRATYKWGEKKENMKEKGKGYMKNKDDDDDDDEDESDDDDMKTLRDASRQIAEATQAAVELKRKLDRKDYDRSLSTTTIAEVSAVLTNANKDIAEAKAAREDGDFEEAYNLADKAEEDLDDAKDVLEGDDDDDEDDDDDDDEDDDDDDDDEDDN